MTQTQKQLRQYFRRKKVATLSQLFRLLKTSSRMTVFRHLKKIGYLTSYTDRGQYYTLSEIPRFNVKGLWLHQGIGFSQHGSLVQTLLAWVGEAPAGLTHLELQAVLKLKVHNTLLVLIQKGMVHRQMLGNHFVYVSAQKTTHQKQIQSRKQTLKQSQPKAFPTSAQAVCLLVEQIKFPQSTIQALRGRLKQQGINLSAETIENFILHHGLEKKIVATQPS